MYLVIISFGAAAISEKCNNKFRSFLTVSSAFLRLFLYREGEEKEGGRERGGGRREREREAREKLIDNQMDD